MRDTLGDGRVFRALTVVDDFTRECPVIEVDTSLTGERVARVLNRVASRGGCPRASCATMARVRREVLDQWAHERGIPLHFIESRKPVQNTYVERFNGRLRDECLNESWFTSLADARVTIERWRRNYNEARPHSGLAESTLLEFAKAAAERTTSITTTGPT